MIKFNLLPSGDSKKSKESGQRVVAAAVVLVVVAMLGVTALWQSSRVSDAEDALAQAQDTLQSLDRQITSLDEFAVIRDDRRLVDDVLSRALERDMSLLAVLEDVGANLPEDAWLQSLNANFTERDRPLGSEEFTVGRINIAGVTTGDVSDGGTRIVRQLGDPEGFDSPFMVSLTKVEDETYVNQTGTEYAFFAEVDVLESRLSGAYLDGLPSDLTSDTEAEDVADDADEESSESEG